MTIRTTPLRSPLNLMWLPRWPTTPKPTLRRAFSTSRAARTGSFGMLHLDGRQEERLLRHLDILPLEVEFDRLPEVGKGLFDGPTLAGNVQLGTPRDEPRTLAMDGGRQLELHDRDDGLGRIYMRDAGQRNR